MARHTNYRPIQIDCTDGFRYTVQRDVVHSHVTADGVRVGEVTILDCKYLVREQVREDLQNLRICDRQGQYIRVEFESTAFKGALPLSHQRLSRKEQVEADRARWAQQKAITTTQEAQ